MLLFAAMGRRLGVARLARDPEGLSKGTGAAEAAVFGLLGLMLAFSFSGAASRFEDRRGLVVEEANAVGTAYLRLDSFRRRRSRVCGVCSAVISMHGWWPINRPTNWTLRTETRGGRGLAGRDLVGSRGCLPAGRCNVPSRHAPAPAINEMIDITSTRAMARMSHPPVVVFVMLGLLELIGALLVGYATSANKDRSWLHTTLFAAILAMTFSVIVDLEFPRLGLIQVTAADQILIDVGKIMK